MFEIGDYIVYGVKGVCQVEDISNLDMPGVDKDRLYYCLLPLGKEDRSRIYAPTDNHKVAMRKVITKEEADELISELPEIELLWVPDDKQREARYKEAVCSCDNRMWVSVAKTIYLRRKERTAQGKKATALDERYMRAAENELHSELSVALGIPRENLVSYIEERLSKDRKTGE